MEAQQSFDFSQRCNNPQSQQIFEDNKELFSGQALLVYKLLLNGERLTTAYALLRYEIGDLRRRIKDLRDNGVDVKDELNKGRFKTYFLDTSNQAA